MAQNSLYIMDAKLGQLIAEYTKQLVLMEQKPAELSELVS